MACVLLKHIYLLIDRIASIQKIKSNASRTRRQLTHIRHPIVDYERPQMTHCCFGGGLLEPSQACDSGLRGFTARIESDFPEHRAVA
jgi:hypothetical protein